MRLGGDLGMSLWGVALVVSVLVLMFVVITWDSEIDPRRLEDEEDSPP